MTRTLWKVVWIVILAFGLISSSGVPALAEKGSPGKDVQQLSNRVEKLIKIVEDSTLACETRNSVVRRLRKLDDALRSGNRSAARAFVQAWRQDAWLLQSARVLSPEVGSSLQTKLSGLEDEIGFGWPDKPGPTRHWDPLPICESSAGGGGGSYTPTVADPSADVKIFLKMGLALVPRIGGFLGGFVDLMWPAGGDADTNLFLEIVKQETYDRVATDLSSLYDLLMDPVTGWNKQVMDWQIYCLDPDHGGSFDSHDCAARARDSLWISFGSKVDEFSGAGGRRAFQENGGTPDTDYRLDLLPLFAQFENLYMSLLRDGVLLHEYWKERKDLDPEWEDLDSDMAWNAMAAELDPANTDDKGVAYVNKIYDLGLPPEPHDPADWDYTEKWDARNSYIRDKTLNILDYRDTWKYMDPRAYPKGVPGGVKLTRIIYSDLVGNPEATPILPHNVAGPLKEVSVWTKWITGWFGGNLVVGSAQATSPPLLGPAQSGAVQGDTTPVPNHAHYYNLSALGPIIQVNAQEALASCGATSIDFVWAAGGDSRAGDYCSNQYHQVFNYDGEVLATVQVIGPVKWDNKAGNIADAFVFGFRYADSFNPASEVIGVHSGKCIRLASWTNGTQAEIYSCNEPPTPDQIWTYDPALEQISVTNPAEWSDTADESGNPTNGGKHCLDTVGGSTALHTPVVINACDDGAVGTPWKASGTLTRVVTTSPHSGTYSAQLGFSSPFKGNSTLTQTVTVPSGTSALSYWYQPHCPGSTNDHIQMQIRSTSGETLANVMNVCSNSGVWTNVTFDASAYAGQTVVLWFNAYDDGSPGNPTYFLLDDVAVTGSTAWNVVRNGDFETGNFSSGMSTQRWTIDAVGAGIANITHVKSGLVLDVYDNSTANGTPLQLYTYGSGNTAQQWRAHDPLIGEIHGIGSGRCLDVSSWSSGTQALIYWCHGGTSQQWTYWPASKELTVTSPSGPMCLDARNGGTTAGTAVQIYTCNGTPAQQWTLHGDGSAISNDKSGLVLDVKGGDTANGTLVQLYTSSGAQNQQWSRTSSRGGALIEVGVGKCLDLSDWANNTQAVIHSCYIPLGAAQTWKYHPFAQTYTVDSPSGPKCLDARGGGTTDGTAVVINDCTGAASQRWTRDFGSSTVTNVNSGLVLDVQADGTFLHLTPLGTPVLISQKWVWSLD